MQVEPLNARERDFIAALVGSRVRAAVREIAIRRGEGAEAREKLEDMARTFLAEYFSK